MSEKFVKQEMTAKKKDNCIDLCLKSSSKVTVIWTSTLLWHIKQQNWWSHTGHLKKECVVL